MNNLTKASSNSLELKPHDHELYFINPNSKISNLLDALESRIFRALALSDVGAGIHIDGMDTENIQNYFWTLNDIISEMKLIKIELRKKLLDRSNSS